MSRPKKNQKKIKQLKTKQVISETKINKEVMKEYLDAATIINESERDVAINCFFSKYTLNIKDLGNIVKKIDESLSWYFPSSTLHDDVRLLKTNIYHHTLHKLLPLCNTSTSSLRETIVQNNFNTLMTLLEEMVNNYSDKKLHGEQYLEHYNHIKEKSQWYHEYAKTYFIALSQDIKKNHLSEKNIKQLSDILSTHDKIIDFYNCHTSLFNEKTQIQSITLELIENIIHHLREIISTKEQLQNQSRVKLKKQSDLEEKLKKEIETLEILSYYKDLFSNFSPITEDTLNWCLFLEKIQSIYNTFEGYSNCHLKNNDLTEATNEIKIEDYLSCLKKINDNSKPENINSNIITINNMLNIFSDFSTVSLERVIEAHEKIMIFLDKNTPSIETIEEDKAHLIHHVCKELFITIKEKILNAKAKQPFDINQYLDYASILDRDERNHKINSIFSDLQHIKINNVTFSLILEQIENRPFSACATVLSATYNELENINIFNTTLNKILPLCEDINKDLELKLINSYLSSMTSSLATIIGLYTQEDEENDKSTLHIELFDHIKEKMQWLTTDINQYQKIICHEISNEKSPEQIEDTWTDLNNIILNLSQILYLLSNQAYFFHEKNKLTQEINNFLNAVAPYFSRTKKLISDQHLLETLYFIERDFNQLRTLTDEANHPTKDHGLINDFFENIVLTYKCFKNRTPKQIDIVLDDVNNHLKNLLAHNKNPEEVEIQIAMTDMSSALRLLTVYSKLDIENHTQEIITKHNALCKQLLQLLNKIAEKSGEENAHIFKSSKLLIKLIFQSILNDHNEFSHRPVEEEIIPAILSAEKNDINPDMDETEKSFKEIDLNSAPIIVSLEEPSKLLESIDLEKEHIFKLQQMTEAYQTKEEEANRKYRQSLQEEVSHFQAEKAKKRKELQKNITNLNKAHADKITELKNRHQSELKTIEQNSEKLFDTCSYQLETQYLSKELDLQYEIVYSYERQKIKIRKELNHLENIYAKQFINKSKQLKAEQTRKLQDVALQYKEVLEDLSQAQNRNLLKFETYVSKIFEDQLKITHDAMVNLKESVSDYSVNDISKIIHNHSLPQVTHTQEVIEEKTPPETMFDKSIKQHELIDRMEIPALIKFMLSFLKDADVEFYFIGGFVRNFYLKQSFYKDDINIIVNADSSKIKSIFKDKALISHHPKLVTIDNISFWCEPWGNDLISALRTKDLAINTLIANMDGKIYNLLGIDFVKTFCNIPGEPSFLTILDGNSNTDARFKKDPALILRCIKFAVSFHQRFQDEDWTAVANNAHLISTLPTEIYLDNIERMFCRLNSESCFLYIQSSNLLTFVFPFLSILDTLELEKNPILNSFITSKLTELSYAKDTSPLAIIALMMIVPILRRNSCDMISKFIEERLQYEQPKDSDRLEQKPGLLNRVSIIKSVISYCLGGFNSLGYVKQFFDYQKMYFLQSHNVLNQNLQLTNQYNHGISTQINTQGSISSDKHRKTRISSRK